MDAIVSGVMLEHGQQCDLPGMPVGGVLNRSVEESLKRRVKNGKI